MTSPLCRTLALAVFFSAGTTVVPARAQSTSPARVDFFETPTDCFSSKRSQANADALAGTFYGGDAARTNAVLIDALANCGLTRPSPGMRPVIDTTKDYVLVSLITKIGSTNVSDAVQPQILHFLVHHGASDYRLTLPGVRPSKANVYQVVLYEPSNLAFISTLTETQVASPLATDLAAFVKQISLPAYWVRPQVAVSAKGGAETKPILRAQIGEVPIRFGEATIAVTESAQIAPSDDLSAADIKSVRTALLVQDSIIAGFGKAAQWCTRQLSAAVLTSDTTILKEQPTWDRLSHAVDAVLNDFDCKRVRSPEASGIDTVRTRYAAAVAKLTAAVLTADTTILKRQATWNRLTQVVDSVLNSFDTNILPALTAAGIDTVRARYLAAVAAPSPTQVSGSASIANAPLVRFRYAAVVGALVGPMRPGDQVKPNTDSKVYDPDPVGRAMTMAAVSFFPFPYDSTTTTMTLQKRFSIDAGPVLTPAGGVAGGVSIGLARGLMLSGGVAWLVVGRGPAGQRPNDVLPTSGRLLTTGIAHSLYAGLSFSFP